MWLVLNTRHHMNEFVTCLVITATTTLLVFCSYGNTYVTCANTSGHPNACQKIAQVTGHNLTFIRHTHLIPVTLVVSLIPRPHLHWSWFLVKRLLGGVLTE